MNGTPAERRAEALAALTRSPLDILVIGGGIVGSGIARDAAMRGLRIGLIERHDFAFGTSSRSSRLLHGGMRYLAQGRIGLVREASVEKKVIHRIAPHLAAPLPFVFPTYKGNKHWVLWQLKIGVKMYDLLCGGRNLGKSTWLTRNQATGKFPGLRAEGLAGAVRYYDGFTNDARLTIDTLRSASRNGAIISNYCRYRNADHDELWECEVEDTNSGKLLKVRSQTVVNATGPWADGLPHSAVKLRLTKGVHVLVPRARLPVPETVVMTERKRILFAIPWGERTVLGTTDTDYQGSLEHVRVEAQDISYVLDVANVFFPTAKLNPQDVISTWAGVRPLIADPNGRPSDISRSHEINTPEPGWWDVAGGKLTTYRLMAEQTVDRIVRWLRESDRVKVPVQACQTADEILLPPAETEGVSAIIPPEVSRKAVEHYCVNEWAIHLDDLMIRRTAWHYYHPDAPEIAKRVATWMSQILGWSSGVHDEEMARYQRAGSRDSEHSSQRTHWQLTHKAS